MMLLVILFLFMCSSVQSQDENKFAEDFKVEPTGTDTVIEKEWVVDDKDKGVQQKRQKEEEEEKYRCTFTYRATGGTNEQWQFIMEKLDDGKMLRCTVSRGTTSYLHFANFTMSLTGPNVKLQDYEAISYLEKRLKDEEVKMKKKKKMVYAVVDKFENKLERVTLTAKIAKKKKKKEEL